jgi:hypothetical protein
MSKKGGGESSGGEKQFFYKGNASSILPSSTQLPSNG